MLGKNFYNLFLFYKKIKPLDKFVIKKLNLSSGFLLLGKVLIIRHQKHRNQNLRHLRHHNRSRHRLRRNHRYHLQNLRP